MSVDFPLEYWRPSAKPLEEGKEYEVDNRNDLPLRIVDILGHGGTAKVEKVQDTHTGTVYARKSFKFQGSRVEAMRIFRNEVRIINRLAPHHHVVRVYATYVAKREVGLLITPVANGRSLDELLQSAHDDGLSSEDRELLWSSFPCLINGLHFMHNQRVRHKDIKPHNILIHNRMFMYTDFGGSLDYSDSTRSITTGPPTSITRRYAAPEIYNHAPRTSKTDIFSLGCVFFEILSTLGICQHTQPITPYGIYHEQIRDTLAIELFDESVFSLAGTIKGSTLDMLMPEAEHRPSAETLLERFVGFPDAFCTLCKVFLSVSKELFSVPLKVPEIRDCSTMIHNECFTDQSALDLLSRDDIQTDHDILGGEWLQSVISDVAKIDYAGINYEHPSDQEHQSFSCSYCNEILKSRTDLSQHMLRHEKPFKCNEPGCPRVVRGFNTINGLDRHGKKDHRTGHLPKSYICASEMCKNKNKIWLRHDNFKAHIRRMHVDEDLDDLLKRSLCKPESQSRAPEGGNIDDDEVVLAGIGDITSENNLPP